MVVVRTGAPDDLELARRAVAGDGAAFAGLFERWFDRAFDVAWHIVRNRDTAAEVAQETFATAWQQIGTLRQPESFGGWVLRIARNKGLNRLAVEQRARPVGDQEALADADRDRDRRVADDPAEPVMDRERDDLVWAASAALGDADASLLSLHMRHGLDAGELAGELGIAPNAAHQRLFRLKKRLGDAIGAWTLWQVGRPRCDTLRALLANAGTTRFDRDAAAMITAHTRGCPECEDRRTLAVSPEAMFAAMPLVAAGPAVKAEAAAALADAGVPAPSTTPGSGLPPPTPGAGGETAPGVAEPGSPGRKSRRSRRATRRITMLAIGAVLAGAVVVVLARRGDDASDLVVAPTETSTPAETSTTRPGTSTTAPDASAAPAEAPGSTAAPATAPAPVVTPPPTTTTPPAPPPGPPTEPEEPEEPDPGPPVVGSFQATPSSAGACADPGEVVTTFTWTTTGATSARLGPGRDVAMPVDPTGDHRACAFGGSTWTLTVTGPGGTTAATVTVP